MEQLIIIGARPYEEVCEDCHALKGGLSPFDDVVTRNAEGVVERMPDLGDIVLVPVPSHHGTTVATYALAWAVARLYNSRQGKAHASVLDCLECIPHVSLCEAKHEGMDPSEISIEVKLRGVIDIERLRGDSRRVLLVDNVVDTGATARACMEVVPAEGIIAVGDTGNRM